MAGYNAFLIDEKFEEIGQTSLDTKQRVTLKRAVDVLRQHFGSDVELKVRFTVACNSAGQILLSPETTIPLHEAWLHKNKEAMASLQRGIEQAGKGQLNDLGSFAQYGEEDDEQECVQTEVHR